MPPTLITGTVRSVLICKRFCTWSTVDWIGAVVMPNMSHCQLAVPHLCDKWELLNLTLTLQLTVHTVAGALFIVSEKVPAESFRLVCRWFNASGRVSRNSTGTSFEFSTKAWQCRCAADRWRQTVVCYWCAEEKKKPVEETDAEADEHDFIAMPSLKVVTSGIWCIWYFNNNIHLIEIDKPQF